MAESTVRWFIMREKHYSFAEIVRLIRQANMAYIHDHEVFNKPVRKNAMFIIGVFPRQCC